MVLEIAVKLCCYLGHIKPHSDDDDDQIMMMWWLKRVVDEVGEIYLFIVGLKFVYIAQLLNPMVG